MNVDELDYRIRSGVTALIDRAPEPRPFPDRTTTRRAVSPHRGRRVALVAAATVVIAGFAGIGWMIRDEDRDPKVHATDGDTTTTPRPDAEWQPLPPGPVDGRTFPVFARAGDQLVVWGGETQSEVSWTNTGAVFDPISGIWSRTADGPLAARSEASAVWTGERLFVCCGRSPDGAEATDVGAAMYDPATDTWQPLPNAASTVAFGTAVWTGDEVLIIGPRRVGYPYSPTVAMTFDPAGNVWRRLPDPPTSLGPSPSISWTGGDAVIWPHSSGLDVGYALDVDTGEWTPLPVPPDELAIAAPTMVAAGDRVMLWGTPVAAPDSSAGAVLDRSNGEWTPMSGDPLGVGEDWEGVDGSSSSVWTGDEMVIWTGAVAAPMSATTTRVIAYDPATDRWRELPDAPMNGHAPPLVVIGDSLVVGTGRPMRLGLGG